MAIPTNTIESQYADRLFLIRIPKGSGSEFITGSKIKGYDTYTPVSYYHTGVGARKRVKDSINSYIEEIAVVFESSDKTYLRLLDLLDKDRGAVENVSLIESAFFNNTRKTVFECTFGGHLTDVRMHAEESTIITAVFQPRCIEYSISIIDQSSGSSQGSNVSILDLRP